MCVIDTSPFFLLASETYMLATIAAAFAVVGLQCKAVSSPILSSVNVVLAVYAETGEKKFSDFNDDTQNYLMHLQKNLATKYNLPPHRDMHGRKSI